MQNLRVQQVWSYRISTISSFYDRDPINGVNAWQKEFDIFANRAVVRSNRGRMGIRIGLIPQGESTTLTTPTTKTWSGVLATTVRIFAWHAGKSVWSTRARLSRRARRAARRNWRTHGNWEVSHARIARAVFLVLFPSLRGFRGSC